MSQRLVRTHGCSCPTFRCSSRWESACSPKKDSRWKPWTCSRPNWPTARGRYPHPTSQPARNPSRITAHVPSPDQRRCRE
jgi:hypothetical protein